MPRAAFLESRAGTWSLFTRGLVSGARSCGWETCIVPLADASGAARPAAAVVRDLCAARPDRAVFLMDAALRWAGLWRDGPLRGVPTDALWYDDWMRSPATLSGREAWVALASSVNVRIWDAHWAGLWGRRFGFPAGPALLAASPEDFDAGAEPAYPELRDNAVFVGTVPSWRALDDEARAFPPFLRSLLRDVGAALDASAWPIDAYGAAERVVEAAPRRVEAAARRWLDDPIRLALWNTQVWRRGKRAARLRGLRAVAAVAPLAVLSGHRSEVFAGGEELLAELGAAHIEFRDTTACPAGAWSGLFRSGAVQVQVTDPQSVESGIPFRWFETAACGVPVVADARPGLAGIALPDERALLADGPAELAAVVEGWIRCGPAARAELGALRRAAFLRGHTWAARWEVLAQAPSRRAVGPSATVGGEASRVGLTRRAARRPGADDPLHAAR